MKYVSILALVLLMGCDQREKLNKNYCVISLDYRQNCILFDNMRPNFNDCCFNKASYEEFLKTKPECK